MISSRRRRFPASQKNRFPASHKKSRNLHQTCGIVKLALISGQYTNRMLSTHNTLPGQPVNAF